MECLTAARLLTVAPVHIDDARLPANGQTVWPGGGSSCAIVGQLLPLQAVWQVSIGEIIANSNSAFGASPQVVSSFQTSLSYLLTPGCSTKSSPVTLT